MGEICAFGAPHRSGHQTDQNGGGDQRVPSRVELGPYVKRVAEHANGHCPLDAQFADEKSGHEDAAEDQRHVDGAQGGSAQTGIGVDGTLQVRRALIGREEKGEGDADEKNVDHHSPHFHRLFVLCGARPHHCPLSVQTLGTKICSDLGAIK